MHKILKLLLDNYHEVEYKERDFSREDMIKIVHDFFKTIDDQLFIMLTGVLNDQSVRVFIDQPSRVNKEKNNLADSKDKPELHPSESHQGDSEEILKAMNIASEGIKSTLNIFKK